MINYNISIGEIRYIFNGSATLFTTISDPWLRVQAAPPNHDVQSSLLVSVFLSSTFPSKLNISCPISKADMFIKYVN